MSQRNSTYYILCYLIFTQCPNVFGIGVACLDRCIARDPRKHIVECDVFWMSDSRESCKEFKQSAHSEQARFEQALLLVDFKWRLPVFIIS